MTGKDIMAMFELPIDDTTEVNDLIVLIDAAILDAATEQAIADCKSVCSLCGTVVFSGDRHFTDEGIDLCCDALAIRAAYKAATGKELEVK